MNNETLRVAVIGSGISGLSAAWLLSQRHHVTLYEAGAHFGGHSNTVVVEGPNGAVAVDTGFIVYNETNYPNLTAMFAHLGVETTATDMSFAVSAEAGRFEYAGTDLRGLLAQPGNLLKPGFWRMLNDIRRFYAEAPRLLEKDPGISLGAYLDAGDYSDAFIRHHIIPMGAAIWSTPAAKMLDFPASGFVRFCENHGLLRLSNRPQWRTVAGGSRQYVRRLLQGINGNCLIGIGATSIERTADGVTVRDQRGESRHYDHVVIATHADMALKLLAQPDALEAELLGCFGYQRNRAVLHSDRALMPQRRAAWASWNYLSGAADGDAPIVTYWMNRLQHIDPALPLFVTLNPQRDPDPNLVHAAFDYDHPVFDAATDAAQKRLWSLQGRGNVWFCGAHFGWGFHEDGLQSGLAVAEALGGVRRPWSVANESCRIHLGEIRQRVAAS